MKQVTYLLFSFLTLTASAQPNYSKQGIDTTRGLPTGLAIGAEAPDFTTISTDSVLVNLSSTLSNGPVVLLFYRGAWCPVCSRYLKAFEDSISMIRNRGAEVIAITPETLESALDMINKSGTSATVVIDGDGSIARNYGVNFYVTSGYVNKIKIAKLTNIATHNNQEEAQLPVPATYIIDQDGIIIWRQFDPNYKNRASVKAILEHLPK